MRLHFKCSLLAALLVGICTFPPNLFGDETVVFRKAQENGCLVGKHIPIPRAEIEAEEKWIAQRPLKPGYLYVPSDTEIVVEWIEGDQVAQRIWSKKLRLRNHPKPINYNGFTRAEGHILAVHYDTKLSSGVIIYWYRGSLWAEVVTKNHEGQWKLVSDPNSRSVGYEFRSHVVDTGVVFDPESGNPKLNLVYSDGKRVRFLLENKKWKLEE